MFGVLAPAYFLFFKKYNFALLSLLIIAGAAYFIAFDYSQDLIKVPFGESAELRGIVLKAEQFSSRQRLIVGLENPYGGKIQVNASRYPDFKYGDRIAIGGSLKKPESGSLDYYRKENISGIINYAKIDLLESDRGNFIKAALLHFKGKIIEIFKNNLPAEKAAFLAGLTLGERQEFSDELKDKMSLSGTTHLVALSGYNITIIALAAGGFFGFYFSQTITFYLSALIIILFVLMAGGEASIIRAAIMGVVGLLAKETERLYSARNAIIVAAFLMAIANPRVLVFDLGFQLSFAALLGIVYLQPVLKELFKADNPGFLKWKENSIATLSAQLAVIPFLLGNFGIFSATSFLSNILIAEAIPITMALGFLTAGLGFISSFLAQIAGLAVNIPLSYELWIIDIFSRFTLPIAAESFGFLFAILYYLLLIGFICKFRK